MAEKSRGEGGVSSGADCWKRIVVSLIFDGLDPADKEALECVESCLSVWARLNAIGLQHAGHSRYLPRCHYAEECRR